MFPSASPGDFREGKGISPGAGNRVRRKRTRILAEGPGPVP
ncbi:hypothetical protein ACFFX0_11615 [Citricoccus parietis]|uniref:Uncharacterized protein n=1 Tax=Citricoccus parietis TaxID=592307 RepID=A0ABV5FYR5_9MICC